MKTEIISIKRILKIIKEKIIKFKIEISKDEENDKDDNNKKQSIKKIYKSNVIKPKINFHDIRNFKPKPQIIN